MQKLLDKLSRENLTILGCMSGTSMDGIDISIVLTDGDKTCLSQYEKEFNYSQTTTQALRAFVANPDIQNAQLIDELSQMVTDDYLIAFKHVLTTNKNIDLIGVHGQTIWHDPVKRKMIQIGDAQKIANDLKIPVVSDHRRADFEADGEGAPLAPCYHDFLTKSQIKPLMVANIGGVSNITYIDDKVYAFDTGTGNALLDDLLIKAQGQAFDGGGKIAMSGTVDDSVLATLMNNPYFKKPFPKSLDRGEFSLKATENLQLKDALATLAAFSAQAISAGVKLLAGTPKICYITGGGRKNARIMQELNNRLPCMAVPIEELGINGGFVESEAFAYFSARSILGLNYTFPTTTGAPKPMSGGKLYLPRDIID